MKKSIFSGIAVAMLLAAPSTVAFADSNKLVFLHTNDTHSRIDPEPESDLGGVARRKVLIDSIRNEYENVVLIDAGDVVQGTLFFNLYKGEVENKVANALGYDIRILGNHEFDNGMDGVRLQVKGSDSQWLSTNYTFSDPELAKRFAPYTIRTFNGKKVGFIGLNLNPKGMIAAGSYDGVEYIDMYEAANATAWLLKKREGCDLVVAVTHVGYRPGGSDTNDMKLASTSKHIDIILGGHSHTVLNPCLSKSVKPWVVANADGEYVVIAQNGGSGKTMSEVIYDFGTKKFDYNVLTVDKRLDSRVDPKVEEIIAPYRAGVDSLMNLRVAKTDVDLTPKSPCLLNFLADYMKVRGNEMVGDVDFGMMNTGGVRNGIKAGDITEGQVLMMLPFNNKVEVISISGKDLIENFDIIVGGGGISASVSSELDVTYDPIARKCTKVLYNGKPLDPAKTYKLAIIDYLANGGDYMEPLTRARKVAVSNEKLSTDLLKYLRKNYSKKSLNLSHKKRIHTEGE